MECVKHQTAKRVNEKKKAEKNHMGYVENLSIKILVCNVENELFM